MKLNRWSDSSVMMKQTIKRVKQYLHVIDYEQQQQQQLKKILIFILTEIKKK